MFILEGLEMCAYVFSLAFQIAGAVLLIIKYWGRTKERIIDEYFPGSNIIDRDDDENVKLNKEKVQKCAQTIYDNRMAFIFIVVGYILSIFGETNGMNQWLSLVLIAVSTFSIIILEKYISIVVSEKNYPDDIETPYKKIENKADTNILESEIDQMFYKK